MDEVAKLVPGRPDVAAGIREEVEVLLRQLCVRMDWARRDGFEVSFSIGENAGRRVVTALVIAKHF